MSHAPEDASMPRGPHRLTQLRDPIQIGSLALRNRLYRAPVLEGAGQASDPAAAYAHHFVPNARAGLGLIIQGNTIVLPEGRTSPGMTAVDGRDTMLSMKPMTDAVHEAGGRIVVQLGHGGSFALEAWHRDFAASRARPPLAPSPLPLWLRPFHGGVHVPDTSEVERLVERFGLVASWAREAGYDGVQLAGANAKLLHQFASPTYNKRQDRFGGSTEGRMRLMCEIREAIARAAGRDFPVLLKMPAVEKAPIGPGITLEEGVAMARIAQEAGFDALTPVAADALPNTAICRGDFPAATFDNTRIRAQLIEAGGRRQLLTVKAGMWMAARRYPFTPAWNRPVFKAIKASLSIPIFAVGGIRTPAEAEAILQAGQADLIGVGRPFYAEPDLAARFLDAAGGARHAPTDCANCNRCIVPQMLGMAGICYNPRKVRSARAAIRAEMTPS